MVKAAPIKTSWNAGEWTPLLDGHINLERWADSSRLLQNMIVLKQGPITRRGGTRFIKEVKNSTNNTALIPFEYNFEQEYQIEAGHQYFRFYTSNSIITEAAQNITAITKADPAVVTYSGVDPSNGDEVFISGVGGMVEVNNKFFIVANVNAGANTFELTNVDGNNVDSTNFTTYTSGGTFAISYEIASPYDEVDLFTEDGILNFQTAQSADVLFIAHKNYAFRSLNRLSNTSWSINEMVFNDGPYLPVNNTETTLTLSGTTGSVTVTASSVNGINNNTGFKTTDVGRLIRFKDPANNWTWLRITAFTSTTQVTALISGENTSAGTATKFWRLGLFSETTGYPGVLGFFQDRMFLAGSVAYPDRWALTRTGGYSSDVLYFAPTDQDGTVTDDAGITGTLQSGKVNAIQWIGSDDKGLIIGTAAQEWVLRASNSNEVLTPSNAKADPFSSVGSAYIQPAQIENGTIFAQRARRKILDIIYSLERDSLKPRDLTITCEHITRTGIAEIKFQQEPINCIWIRRTDGVLIGYTYYPDEAVFGAHRHILGGSDVIIKSISVIPSAKGSRDELWLIVERTINNVTRKYIEYMEKYYEDDIPAEDAFCVDCGLTYSGVAASVISGLDHLEGETVKLMVDGRSHPDLIVENGSVTLVNNREGTKINIGLSNTWAWKSQRIEAGSSNGTAQGKTKRITSFVVRLLNTLGLYYGKDETNYEEWDFNQGADFDEQIELFSGDTIRLVWPAGYDSDGTIYLQHDGVFPATITALMPIVTTQDG